MIEKNTPDAVDEVSRMAAEIRYEIAFECPDGRRRISWLRDRLEVSADRARHLYHGRRPFKIGELATLADAFGCSVTEFFRVVSSEEDDRIVRKQPRLKFDRQPERTSAGSAQPPFDARALQEEADGITDEIWNLANETEWVNFVIAHRIHDRAADKTLIAELVIRRLAHRLRVDFPGR